MKKYIKYLVLIIVALFSFTSIMAYDDITPPTIISFTADNHNLEVGDTFQFHFVSDDDFSGTDTLYVQWVLKSDTSKSISKQFYNIDNECDLSLEIANNTYAGEWEAVYISISDTAGNYDNIDKTSENETLFSNLDFVVADTNQDTEPPVVSNVRMVTACTSVPCQVKIQFDATDAKSGVNTDSGGVIYSIYSDPGNETLFGGSSISDNTFQSTIYLDSKYKKYNFIGVQVSDNSGNWKNYTKEELGIGNELDLIPSNFEEDTIAPVLNGIDYEKDVISIPDSISIDFNLTETQSGFRNGRAYIKSDDGLFDNIYYFSQALDNHGVLINDKGNLLLSFNDSETYRGKVYIYKLEFEDAVNNESTYLLENGDFDKYEIEIKKVEKEYTLITSSEKAGYIDEISALPDGSTVLCNVTRNNQIIRKELFDAIKGRDITVTFTSFYQGSTNTTSSMGSISSNSTDTGIQWIINGKDIINPTKDVDMTVSFSTEKYSKYIIPEYVTNKNLERDFWNNVDFSSLTDKEREKLNKELVKLQKKQIKSYFDSLKKAGYKNIDEIYKRTINSDIYENSRGASWIQMIIMANDYTDYVSMKFADNGLLPGKMTIRLKPTYATRGLIGAKNLKLFFVDNDNYSLLYNNINIDEDNYYNFVLDHNSEYWLTNGNLDKLEKGNVVSDEKSSNPKTGDIIVNYILLLFVSTFVLIIKDKKCTSK